MSSKTNKIGKIVKANGQPMDKPSIMLGRPISREPMWENQIKFQRASQELINRGYKLYFEDMESIEWWLKHHSSARNNIVSAFLNRPDCEYLIWIDDDMTFNNLADDIEKMIAADKDMVMGITSCKPVPHFPNLGKVESIREVGTLKFGDDEVECFDMISRHIYDFPEDKLFEVDFGSMGLACVKRKVVEKMGAPWCYFPPNFKTNNVFGEDVSFFINAKMCGFELWCDPTINLGHLGYTAWNYKSMASHWGEFKDGLIKEATKDGLDSTHKLYDSVQAIFKEKTDKRRMLI